MPTEKRNDFKASFLELTSRCVNYVKVSCHVVKVYIYANSQCINS